MGATTQLLTIEVGVIRRDSEIVNGGNGIPRNDPSWSDLELRGKAQAGALRFDPTVIQGGDGSRHVSLRGCRGCCARITFDGGAFGSKGDRKLRHGGHRAPANTDLFDEQKCLFDDEDLLHHWDDGRIPLETDVRKLGHANVARDPIDLKFIVRELLRDRLLSFFNGYMDAHATTFDLPLGDGQPLFQQWDGRQFFGDRSAAGSQRR
jgi:hypothetical protein